ncbi:MAG: hypothetical protein GF399_08610 [Candidatus Coatesbacteria bacterium]|nr:hypothetical protein [Candidatus Coatesbacteria bacterium]
MANLTVKRLELLLHGSRRRECLRCLAAAGVVELESRETEEDDGDERPDPEPARRSRRLRERIERALDYLDRLAPKAGFFEGLMGRKVETADPFDDDFDAEAAVERVEELVEEASGLRKRLERLSEERAALERWRGLPVAPNGLGGTRSAFIGAYSLNLKQLGPFNAALIGAAGELVHSELLDTRGGEALLLLAWHTSVDDEVREVLKGFELSDCPLSGDTPPAERLEDVSRELEEASKELERSRRRGAELLELRDPLYLALDRCSTIEQGEEVVANSTATEQTILLRGWVPPHTVGELEEALGELELVHYELRDPDADEEPPVYLKNRGAVRPFEMVTDLYGRPRSGEFDPTPLFAFFFALYFGLCLTDAGYGLLLILASWAVLRFLPLAESTTKMFRLLMIAGGFTVVVGLLTGGIFGLDFEALHIPALQRFRQAVMIIDPLDPEQMFQFFYFTLGLGYLQILVGYVIGFFNALRVGDRSTAYYRRLPWILLMLVIPAAVGLPALAGVEAAWLWYLAGGLGLFLLLFSGVGDDSGLPRLGAGFFNLYNGISGLFSDVLSYARLFALGLATAVIAQVINTMAFDASIVGAVLILVVGHVFNLAINALGGFIHTARLQFVEYFDKFFYGGGRPFRPYTHQSRHTIIKRAES